MGGRVFRPGDRIDSFVFVRHIGKGGMAHVVLGRDPDGCEVALKILRASRVGTGLPRFRREFRALSRIHHPNVIRVIAYGDIYNHPYIVMEYVEGTDLHQVIRDFQDMPSEQRWSRCEELLVDVCRGLAHVHDRGLIHRDLKPSNILVAADGHAKLTDFGIVKDLDPGSDPEAGSTLVGTWAYASPEQITGDPLDQRSDLYSLGVILYAMLTGRRPFSAKDMAGYREAHLEQQPRPPSWLVRGVPEHLESIALRLLRKAPKERFQSAQEILFLLERHEESTPVLRHDTWIPPLVGRERELRILREALDALAGGYGGAVLVVGAEGMGRTRLLEATAAGASERGIPAWTVQVRSTRPGIGGLVELGREMAAELGSRSPETLDRALELWCEAEADQGDMPFRLLDGLRSGMDRLLAAGPRLLLVDDLHAASNRALPLLCSLVRGALERGASLLFVGTARESERVEPLLSGEALGTTPTRIFLDPLDRQAVSEMLASLVGRGEKARALAERLDAEAEGNPLFLSQFLASLVQRGVLVPEGRRMTVAADAAELSDGHLEIPPGVRQVIRTRLRVIGTREMEPLQVLAVAARDVEPEVMVSVLGHDEAEILQRMDRLIERGIAVEHRSGGRVSHEIAHRLLGDILYRDLAPDRRAFLHRRLAMALERRFAGDPEGVDLVGEHYRRAGEAGKAYRYLVMATARMHARGLPAEAWDYSDRALGIEERARLDMEPAELARSRIELLRVRADILYGRAEWLDGRKTLEALVELANATGHELASIRASVELGRVLQRLDHAEEGRFLVSEALADARRFHDRIAVVRALHALAAMAWNEGDMDRCEQLAQEGLVLTGGPAMSGYRAEHLLALTAVQAARGELAGASRGLEEADAILDELGRKRTRCVVLCNLAEILVWRGRLAEALDRTGQAARLAREADYRVGRALAARCEAEALIETGADARAERALLVALEETGELGLQGEAIACRYALARLAARRGDAAATEAHVSVARSLAAKRDPERYGPALVALNAWACALTGDHSDARRMLDVADAGLHRLPLPRRCQALLGAARARSSLGDDEAARRLLTEAAGLCASRGFRLWDLEARLLISQIAPDPATAATWRAEAVALARSFTAELPPDLARDFRQRPGIGLLFH